MEKIIPGTNRKYSISDEGVVKNLKTKRLLSVHSNDPKKPCVGVLLCDNGKYDFFTLNTLMIKAFKLQPPDKYHMYKIMHKDGDPWNNNLSNLEWKIRHVSKLNKFYPQPFYNEKGKIVSKVCDKCGENKPISKFILQTHKEGYKKTYKNTCLPCIAKNNLKRILDCPVKKANYLKRSKEFFATPNGRKWLKNYNRNYNKTEKGYTICRKSRIKNKELISDGYIKELLAEPRLLKRKEIPQYLIDLKRKEIQLKRQIDHEKQQKITQGN